MLRAIIFDFDGVIADTEPLHYEAFATVLAEHSVALSRKEYFSRYLGLNDETFIRTIFADRRRAIDGDSRRRIQAVKDTVFRVRIAGGLCLLPGVEAFVRAAAKRWPLAICSGAHRVEIETILEKAGLVSFFDAIVSADEVPISKPDPAGFLKALSILRAKQPDLTAGECLVVEDSLLGVRAAKAAGMKVLAVFGAVHNAPPAPRNAYDAAADAVRESLVGLTVDDVSRMF